MKPVIWMGKSKEDLSGFPDDVKDEAGFAIYAAQIGQKAANAIPMVGYGGANCPGSCH